MKCRFSFVTVAHQIGTKQMEQLQNLQKDNTRNLKFVILLCVDHEVITIDGLIAVPPSLQQSIIAWYHDSLRHPRVTRAINSFTQCFSWCRMQAQVEAL